MDKLLQGLKNTTQKAKTTLKDWLSVDEGETSPSVVERAGQTIQDIFKKDVVKPVPQDGKEYISPAVRTPIQKVADKIRSTETGNILMDAFLGDGTNDYFKGKIDGKEQGFSLLPKQGEGLIEYLLPETTKDDTTRILERYDDLKEKGIEDERATKVAVEDVFKPKAGSMEQFMATKEGKKDDLTDVEKGVLRKKNLMETLGLGLDVVGNTPFGLFAKAGEKKLAKVAIDEGAKALEENAAKDAITVYRGQAEKDFTMEGKGSGIGKSFTTDKKIADVYGTNGNVIEGTINSSDILKYNELDTETKKYIKSIIDERIDEVKNGLDDGNIKPFERLVTELGEIARIKNKKAIDISSFGIPSESEIRVLSADALKPTTKKTMADMLPKTKPDAEDVVAKLKSQKYDGIKVKDGEEVLVWNPQKIKETDTLEDIWKKGTQGATKTEKAGKEAYKETGDLTTKTLKDLEGKETVSKQYILDATNRPELKQVERDLIRRMLEGEGNVVDVKKFADKVKSELLPLKARKVRDIYKTQMGRVGGRYEHISLPDELKGEIDNYDEIIYESPIKNNAGKVHFSGAYERGVDPEYYFGHTRVEDMADKTTRRVIEVQSDLYQKGNLERMVTTEGTPKNMQTITAFERFATLGERNGKTDDEIFKGLKNANPQMMRELDVKTLSEFKNKLSEVRDIIKQSEGYQKLSQYNDPTAHFRMIREEVKKAAEDGKTALQFPTGETAMKIEGLGEARSWGTIEDGILKNVTPDMLKVGKEITQNDSDWIITDVLGDGKFKAVPKANWESMEMAKKKGGIYDDEFIMNERMRTEESFDISGKVDTNNPIYKFYEKDVQRYLKQFGGKPVTDKQGVTWIEVPITKAMANTPVEAYGAFGGMQVDDEGNITYDPVMGAFGVLGIAGIKNGQKVLKGKKIEGMESIGDILKRTTDGGNGTTKTMGDIFTGEVPSKTRRFTVRTEKLAPESKPFLQGKYQAKSNKNLIEEADNLIAKNRDEAIIIAKTDSSDRGIAVASRLLDTLTQEAKATKDINAKNAIYEKIADISNETARNLTEAGRAVQAASILGRLTPEGMVRYASKQIQDHNTRVAKGTLGDMFGGYGKKLEKIPELTGEEVAWIQREMERIGKITDEIQKAKEFQNFNRKMSERIPSSLYTKIATLWKAGLLTGLKTSGLNILSNSAHALSEGAKDVPAVLVDKVISLFTGKRTLALTGKGAGQGAREGVAKGWEYLKTGFDERDIGGKLDYERVNFGKGKVAKLLQKYEEGVFRLIGSQDQPFYYGAKARSLYSQAIAEARNKGLVGEEATKFVNDLVANPTDDMLKYATLDAETAVFQNLTALGTVGRSIQNFPYVGKFILPFAKTPSAVATQLLAYSPLGIVGTLAKYARKGKFDQRLFSQGMGRGLTGTGVMYIGATLYDSGNLALSMPTTEREKKQWELEGKKPNSIKIGDKWVSVAVLGPAGLALLVGGAYRKAYDEAGSVAKGMLQASIGGLKSFGEQTFLKGINQFTNALSDPERYGTPFFSSFIGSWIPTIVADVARATDDYERRSPGLLGKLQSRIPGIREALQPQVDTFGNEIKTPSAVRVMADATRSSDVKPSDNVTKELRRLMDAGYPATPTQVGPRDGYKTLTPSQNTQLLKVSGNLEKTRLAKLMQSEAYKKADDELREKAIQREVDRAKVEARARVIYDAVSGLSKEQRIQKLKEMKDEKLLTKQVFSAYQSIKNNKQ